ncbi:MAG: hypothetical protein WD007_00040, partial [Nitriliruptoraceae bacterium]
MRFTRGRYVTQRRPVDLGAFGGRAAKAGLPYEAFVPASIADLDVRLSGSRPRMWLMPRRRSRGWP